MAEIKRVNIYVGVVGQAYVDKETALANLNAAIKNVHDMEEIIASAQEQQPVAQTVLENAIAAKELAQSAYDQLSGKFDDQHEGDALYVQLLNILNDLNINDTDKNPYNGGSTKTAQENVADINKQITELAQIIADGQESLQRRLAFVDELQVIYDNALEKFKSYLPEEEGYDWEAWDKEEELLKARIQAVIDALANANEITEAINITSKDVIVRAIDAILGVCNRNETTIDEIYTTENQYLNELQDIINRLGDLRTRVDAYNYLYDAQLLINNIANDSDTANNYADNLRNNSIPDITNLGNTINRQIITSWENIKNSINEYFNVNDFNVSVDDIYYVNSAIKSHKQLLTELKNFISRANISLGRYETDYQSIVEREGNQQGEQDLPDFIDEDGIRYYKNDPGRPGANYIQRVINYNGHTYVAWVEESVNPEPQPQPGDLYFSIGTDEVTAENYTTANNAQVVAEYPAETEFTPDSRNYVYVLVKSDKTVQLIDAAVGGILYITEDITTLSGYKIISTNGKVSGKIYVRIS